VFRSIVPWFTSCPDAFAKTPLPKTISMTSFTRQTLGSLPAGAQTARSSVCRRRLRRVRLASSRQAHCQLLRNRPRQDSPKNGQKLSARGLGPYRKGETRLTWGIARGSISPPCA